MTETSKFSWRWCALAGFLGLWALLMVQSCDRNAKRDDATSELAGPDKSAAADQGSGSDQAADSAQTADQSADRSAASSLPGQAKAGTLKPERPGPKGPALFFLAGLKGYLEPCGCSADVLLGGIDRIVGYVEAAGDLYAGTAMIDGGDLLFETKVIDEDAVAQETAKTDVVAAAMDKLGVAVTVPGERDFALGADVYLDTLKQAGIEPIAANLTIHGKKLAASKLLDVGDAKVQIIGYVDPKLYAGIDGIEAHQPAWVSGSAKSSDVVDSDADATVLVMHGDLAHTKRYLDSLDGIDFGIVGHDPRETDQVNVVNGGHTLEAYDQGRYVGVLQLFGRQTGLGYDNAGAASRTKIDKIQGLIEHKKNQIERFPPSKRHQHPPILERLEDDIATYEQKLERLKSASVDVPDTGNAFIYRPVPMKPGWPIDRSIQKRRDAFNKSLKSLQMKVDHEVTPVEAGQPFYVGTNQCAQCHPKEHQFWQKTQHAQAVETLQKRDKLFDQSCIGCHVVGYQAPGGSAIGKLHYEATLGDRTIEKNLEDVGCENCHGPGSQHVQQPVDADGTPQFITEAPGQKACQSCHVPEHSPEFNFEAYVKDITGPGHPMELD